MSDLISIFFPKMRLFCSQVLVICFQYWPFCIPFACYALEKIYSLFRKIY